MAFSVKAVVTLLPVFSHVEEHLGKVWIWQLLRLSGCISCCAGWLSVRSAPVLHFPSGRRLSVQGTREHGKLGASFPSPGKKKGKQLNLFPVFITKIWESGKSNCKHFVGETFWETYAPYTWRGIASPVGLLDPGLSIVFLRGGLLIATEILLPSTSMPSIFSTAWEAWVSSANSTYARPCRATQHKRVNTPTTSSCVWVEGSDH